LNTRSATPDVSVIVPTFRRPGQLREALASALGQAGVTVEAIVIDDSPERSAAPVVEAMADPRVRYLEMEPPTGGCPARVRNTGWPLSSGRFLHFLDDDDRVADGAYAALVRALETTPGVGVAFGRIEPFGDVPEAVTRERAYFANASRRALMAGAVRSRRLMVANMLFKPTVLVCSACMIRRPVAEGIGGFDVETPVVEDVDFFIRAIRRFGCTYLDRPVLHYRVGAPSLMHSPLGESRVDESYRRIFAHYRRTYGLGEFTALKLVARSVLRWL